MIRALFLFIYVGLALVLVLPWFILWSLITGKPDAMYDMAMKAVRLGMRLAGIRVHVEGLENIPPGVCIFAANHTSTIDAMAFIPAIPRRVAILVKKELFRIPFLGTAMRLANFVEVDRADRESAAASVQIAVDRLRHGTSFAVYPEGTRSPDGRLQEFKKGTAVMAIKSGVPVVPVACSGAHRVMEKRKLKIKPGDILVEFLDPVDPTNYSFDEREVLIREIHDRLAAGLPPDQRPLGFPGAA